MLKDFSRSSSSASSFASVVEETEGVDADDTGLVRGPGARGALQRPGGRLLGPCRYSGQKHEPGVAEMRSGDSAAKEYCRLPLPYSEALRGSPASLTERPSLRPLKIWCLPSLISYRSSRSGLLCSPLNIPGLPHLWALALAVSSVWNTLPASSLPLCLTDSSLSFSAQPHITSS